MGIFDKLKSAAKGREDKVAEGLDKAANVVDEKTGGKASEHIQTGVDKAKEQLGVESEPAGEQGQGGQGQQGQGGERQQGEQGEQGQQRQGQGGQGEGGQGQGGQGEGRRGQGGQGGPGNN